MPVILINEYITIEYLTCILPFEQTSMFNINYLVPLFEIFFIFNPFHLSPVHCHYQIHQTRHIASYSWEVQMFRNVSHSETGKT